jgi:hypothetical protein
LLRPPEERDLSAIVALIGEYEVAKNLSTVPPSLYRRARARISRAQRRERRINGTDFGFSILRKEDDTVILGGIGVHVKEGTHEIGYWLGRPYWRAGYATEAARRIVEFAFYELQAPSVWAGWYHRQPGVGSRAREVGCKPNGFDTRGLHGARSRGDVQPGDPGSCRLQPAEDGGMTSILFTERLTMRPLGQDDLPGPPPPHQRLRGSPRISPTCRTPIRFRRHGLDRVDPREACKGRRRDLGDLARRHSGRRLRSRPAEGRLNLGYWLGGRIGGKAMPRKPRDARCASFRGARGIRRGLELLQRQPGIGPRAREAGVRARRDGPGPLHVPQRNRGVQSCMVGARGLQASRMTYHARPLTPDLWPQLEELFGATGACAGCWCMYWRIGSAYTKRPRDENRKALQAIVKKGPAAGLLVFDGDLPSAGCR